MSKKLKKRQLLVVVACVVDANPSLNLANDGSQENLVTKVLLARRNEIEQKEINLMWELPGGKVEPNETHEQAVIREVQEETGYQVEVVEEIPFSYTTQWEYEDFIQQTSIYCYECKLQGKQLKHTPSDHKIKEFQWFDFEAVDFSRTLPGSREFIWHIAQKYSIDLTRLTPSIAFANFTHVDLNKSKEQYYSIILRIKPQVEKPYVVITVQRKPDRQEKHHPMQKEFATDQEARHDIFKRLKDYYDYGYSLVMYSDNFPFKAFLQEFPKRKDKTIQ